LWLFWIRGYDALFGNWLCGLALLWICMSIMFVVSAGYPTCNPIWFYMPLFYVVPTQDFDFAPGCTILFSFSLFSLWFIDIGFLGF
jgi:hypothetical protein